MRNFQHGQDALTTGLTLKTSFLKALPFVFGGLAHPDPTVAQKFAGQALAAWAATPEEHRQLHHRFTRRFFDDDGMRSQMQLQWEGTPLSDLATDYRQSVCMFRFCPCAERVIESYHKDIKLGAAHRRPRLAFASLLLRQRELEDMLDRLGVEIWGREWRLGPVHVCGLGRAVEIPERGWRLVGAGHSMVVVQHRQPESLRQRA